jgi:hypothetical protein
MMTFSSNYSTPTMRIFKKFVDKAIIDENKLKEMEKDGMQKMPFDGQSSGSNTKPRLPPQPCPFIWAPHIVRPSMPPQ